MVAGFDILALAASHFCNVRCTHLRLSTERERLQHCSLGPGGARPKSEKAEKSARPAEPWLGGSKMAASGAKNRLARRVHLHH